MAPPQQLPSPQSLSLDELVRITDVATELRRQRESVSRQLDLHETKRQLRERLLAAARETGEQLTAAEVDAAIDRYYLSLHSFSQPKFSGGVLLAHLYIRRLPVALCLAVFGLAVLLIWWLYFSAAAPLSASNRRAAAIASTMRSIEQQREAIQAIVVEAAAEQRLGQILARVESARALADTAGLDAALSELRSLHQQLSLQYTVRVVSQPNTLSTVDRIITDQNGQRVSGFYLIVEAQSPQGDVLTRDIHNDETDTTEAVRLWGQRVPPEVYDRFKADKQQDGILNETQYAVKQPGYLHEQVLLTDDHGQPLPPMGRITKW